MSTKMENHWMRFFRRCNRRAGTLAQGGPAVPTRKHGEPIAGYDCATVTLGWTNCACYRMTIT